MDNTDSGPRQLSWYHKQGNWGCITGATRGRASQSPGFKDAENQGNGAGGNTAGPGGGESSRNGDSGKRRPGLCSTPPIYTKAKVLLQKATFMESGYEQRRVSLQDKRTLGKKGRGVTAHKPSSQHTIKELITRRAFYSPSPEKTADHLRPLPPTDTPRSRKSFFPEHVALLC